MLGSLEGLPSSRRLYANIEKRHPMLTGAVVPSNDSSVLVGKSTHNADTYYDGKDMSGDTSHYDDNDSDNGKRGVGEVHISLGV